VTNSAPTRPAGSPVVDLEQSLARHLGPIKAGGTAAPAVRAAVAHGPDAGGHAA
jgi:hypothetical protein